MSKLNETVRAKLDTLPVQPGVYVFHGAQGVVLYVGKARSLRSRVRSYFQPGSSDVRAFVARLSRELVDIETFVTGSEKEAALLENELIKAKQPRYNIKLRDDKDFLSLRLDPNKEWPRLEVVRRPGASAKRAKRRRKDAAMYFGPYDSATAARQTLRLVNRYFQLRTCTDAELKSRVRPCLQYQIKRCPAPCAVPVEAETYAAQVRDVARFLGGQHDELVDDLTARMQQAAAAMEYEQAAVHRDQLRAVERVREQQRVVTVSAVDQDVVGMFRQADQAEVAVLRIRAGKLNGVRTFALRDVSLPDDELLASFVTSYFAPQTEGRDAPGRALPDEVLLPSEVEAIEGLSALLSEARGRRVKVLVPQRGPRVRLLEMAAENAEHAFQEKQRADQDVEERLHAIQRRLRLPRLPRRIECIDISHSGGEDTVAAIVALHNTKPDRGRYRSFKVRRVAGGDDYGAMHEVLGRRFRRARDGESGWEAPDLLVVDGGRGQLRMALEALRELGVDTGGVPGRPNTARDLDDAEGEASSVHTGVSVSVSVSVSVVGLAKEKENVAGERLVDRVYLPGQKNPIAVHSTPALQMLALARDEAHRSSNRYRKQLGRKRRLRSELDDIKGVGPKTRQKLLRTLGSLKGVIAASEEELIAAGATRRQAAAIRQALGVSGASGDDSATPSPVLDVPSRGGRTSGAEVEAPAREQTNVEHAVENAIDNAFEEPA